ncbi:hypothetical protein [Thiomicrorhabdus cannonii]|uniref:hypothetical protein n=1 Tax=Thiomicrorhabdus cannonii TaxID=2748011 RepID=UPI0015BCA7EE|nr:hypothetical protein [Thiomicrorhabdus cannonii]
MKFTTPKTAATLLLSALFSASAWADDANNNISQMKNIDLCVNYSTLESEADKKAYFDELNKRGQLSYKDLERLEKREVGTSSTICGMYMALGKPLAEQSRQIRPMTFKAVHVYPDMYYVSQSGMIVDVLERKEGVMPPSLSVDTPKVQPSPMHEHNMIKPAQ